MVSPRVVVGNKLLNPEHQLFGHIVIIKQDTVLERPVPTLDLALGHRMIRFAARVRHILALKPFR